MYAEPDTPHHEPHFHAYYQDQIGIYSLDTLELIGGSLPRRQQRLVEAWGEIAPARIDGGLATIATRETSFPDKAIGLDRYGPRNENFVPVA
jgi:hypothetical protein